MKNALAGLTRDYDIKGLALAFASFLAIAGVALGFAFQVFQSTGAFLAMRFIAILQYGFMLFSGLMVAFVVLLSLCIACYLVNLMFFEK